MKLKCVASVEFEIELENSFFVLYANAVNSRMSQSVKTAVNMIDIITQAVLDGDIEQMKSVDVDLLHGVSEVEGYDEDLTQKEIYEIAGEKYPFDD